LNDSEDSRGNFKLNLSNLVSIFSSFAVPAESGLTKHYPEPASEPEYIFSFVHVTNTDRDGDGFAAE
jgi:hypothetical protein